MSYFAILMWKKISLWNIFHICKLQMDIAYLLHYVYYTVSHYTVLHLSHYTKLRLLKITKCNTF